jgi:predicted outer membrane repeat protein
MPNSPDVPTNRATRRSLTRRGGALGAGGVLVAGSAAALLTALAGQAGAAATITVDSSGDGTADATHCTDGTAGNCTLRDAVAAAVDGDTINFSAAISSITLTDGSIMLGAENIIGPGSASLAITTSAPAAYDVFNFSGAGDVTVSGFSLTENRIKTENQGKFTMNDVSIYDSYAGYGGALYAANSSDLVISGSHFENNESGNANKGGAIYAANNGKVTITDTEIIDNNAQTNGQGGGIFVGANVSSFSLTDSVVTGNTAQNGGGLNMATAGTVTIADSDISSNTAALSGGGAYVGQAGGQVTIDRTTFDGNTAGTGGGISTSQRAVVMTNSTVSNNTASSGGGGFKVASSSQATFNNTTITGNNALTYGGGFYFSLVSGVSFNQSTISENEAGAGGGLITRTTSAFVTLELSGTILSGNSSTLSGFEDVYANKNTALNSDYSVLGSSNGPVVTDLGGTIRSSTPGLLALADNGGPTLTMALDPTSIAIDAGPDPVATFTGNGFDQRGTPWVRVSGSAVDIGAFELQADPPPTSSTTSTSTTSTTAPPASTTTLAIDPNATVGDDPMAPAFTG